MATTYNVTKVNFATTPSAVQAIQVYYKVWNQPITSYTLVTTVNFNTDGTPTAPVAITGLTSGQTYNIKGQGLCGSPVSVFEMTITMP